MKVVIMAGGRGTRISQLFPDIPKPLIPIDGVPVLERETISLRDQGFTDLILTVSYKADKIVNYLDDGQKLGVKIDYFVEDTPLGNAGALVKMRAEGKLDGDFLLLNADSIFDIDFNRLVDYHKKKGGLVTLFTHPNSHPYDSGLIIANRDGRVTQWLTKEDKRPQWYKNRVNAGLHVLNASVLDGLVKEAERIGTVDEATG
ncbi:MAG: nucleotidyltransferase family protein, partial [Eubacterium sp.]|nr:nucleotidyltransferase family protein [Eubacterium sp.]